MGRALRDPAAGLRDRDVLVSALAAEGCPLPSRHRLGLAAAPAAFGLVWAWPLSGLRPEAHRLAAVGAAVVTLWVTEALPAPVTALIGAAACAVLGVAPAKAVFAPFADPMIFLFLGAFILARALFLHGLDRRLAYAVLSIRGVGSRPGRTLVAFGAVTTFLSFWVGNTAVTAMMYAIATSILARLLDPAREGGPAVGPRYATGLLLMTTFGASVGGIATPVGAAPNLIGLGFLDELAGVRVSFLQWCAFGVPASAVLFVYLAAYLGFLSRDAVRVLPDGAEAIDAERRRVGPWTRGQISTAFACALTLGLWLVPGAVAVALGEAHPAHRWLERTLPEPVAALVGALLLFLLPGGDDGPAMTWEEASRIDWGVILLFGGGMALGALASRTGLAQEVGRGLVGVLPTGGGFGLLCAATLTAALVSEFTSNTASATMVVPVVIAMARAAELDPLEPALGATLGSGMGFMLPISTPCNAIVYGSGLVPLRKMAGNGLMLDVVGVAVIVAAVRTIVPLVR